MQKRGVILVLAALVALSLATPVAAAGGGRARASGQGNAGGHVQAPSHANVGGYGTLPGKPLFALVGVITDKGTASIDVEVAGGNRLVKPYIGEIVTIQVTDSTRFRQWTPEGCVPITFDEVETGDSTNVQGVLVDGIFAADRVTVDVPASCCQP